MSEKCIFCEEYKAGHNTFLETDLWRARWDPLPVNPGHVEILPKQHKQYITELTGAEKAEMMNFGTQVMDIIRQSNLEQLYNRLMTESPSEFHSYQKRALDMLRSLNNAKPEAFNIGINDGPQAGQSIHHLHMHIIPRWAGDVENPRGGVRNIFPTDNYRNEQHT